MIRPLSLLCLMLTLSGPVWSADAPDEQKSVRQAYVCYWVAYSSGDVETFKKYVAGHGLAWEERVTSVEAMQAAGRCNDMELRYILKRPADPRSREDEQAHIAAHAAAAKVEISGDLATMVHQSGPTHMRKEGGTWRIIPSQEQTEDHDQVKNRLLDDIDRNRAATWAYNEAADAVISGQLKSREAVKAFVKERTAKNLATQPATRETGTE